MFSHLSAEIPVICSEADLHPVHAAGAAPVQGQVQLWGHAGLEEILIEDLSRLNMTRKRQTHPFWTVFAKLKKVLVFAREGLINILNKGVSLEECM